MQAETLVPQPNYIHNGDDEPYYYWTGIRSFFKFVCAHNCVKLKRQLWSGTVVAALCIKRVSNC